MHLIAPHTPAVTLYRDDGLSWVYRSLQHAGSPGLALGTIAEEGEVPVRPSRNAHHLANPYDDIVRCTERSWKSHRACQHKAAQPSPRVLARQGLLAGDDAPG